ncbi:hypothetical protein OH461_11640 [Vibrio sp. LaRot3]|nr:hypothetical protein [Vibrio sp. LaRot3]MDA0149043.1 hypothetical protein [Vibrio sp. LaRot3]
MPQMYCDCCHKKTAHKIVMKRCDQTQDSLFKAFFCFFSTVVQGDHYVKMEKQYYCRACNHQSEPQTTILPNVKAA